MDTPIASAVVLPDPESPPPAAPSPASGTKRRQSSLSEQDAKRARFNGESAPANRRDSTSTANAPPAPKGRERGRERRLFGAVLGALSQNPATAGQKRRSEIERRQQTQRKLDDEESSQRKAERLAKRKAQRWREQSHFEKASMRIRHDNLLAMAHFLRTTAEPQLLYKPWETTPDEDDRIRDQITEAQDTIRRELEQYEHQHEGEQETSSNHNADMPGLGKESGVETHVATATAIANSDSDGREEPLTKPEQKGVTNNPAVPHDTNTEAMDETGEEIVEAAEDTVIY